MAFKTIHTLYGLQRMAAAEATGVPINLVAMAVGDGNGNATTPTEAQTLLVRETFRAAPNRVFQDPTNPVMFTAELIVPASVGGFVIRECGIFDDAGGLFAVANIPDAYKPNEGEGAYADTVVRLQFIVSNAAIVTLQIDPNVAVATQTWIINNITPATIIPGGTTNQLLAKESNADGDFKWVDLDGVNVTVDCIEETQTLADAQTVVDLATVTTRGLAVYIEGVRLRTDQWTPDVILATRITLAESYPAGTKLVAAQNDPNGAMPDPLLKNQNLEDVADKPLARTNLGVDSKLNTDTHAPPSAIMYFPRGTAPSGWLKANGAAINRTAYASLFAVIGTAFGIGDGFNTFNLPDLRGEFIRGWDDARGVDPGRGNGSVQDSQNRAHAHSAGTGDAGIHNHPITIAAAGEHAHGVPIGSNTGGNAPSALSARDNTATNNTYSAGNHTHGATSSNAGLHAHAVTVDQSGGTEARPRNMALLACIKY